MLAAIRNLQAQKPLLALMLVVSALLMRALVPQGWMPDPTADRWQIILCSGSGPMPAPAMGDMPGMADAMMPGMDHAAHAAMTHGMDRGQTGHGQPDSHPDHPCAFAAVAPTLLLPALLAVLPARLALVAVWRPHPTATVGQGLAAPPPPAIGPPTIS